MAFVERKGIIETPGPGLPEVVSEIVDRLLGDDWCRFSKLEKGTRVFYVIGYEAFMEHEAGDFFDHLDFPSKVHVGPLGEWFVRSQLADKQPDYWKRIRKALRHERIPLNPSGNEEVTLLGALVETLRSERLEESRRQEIGNLLAEVVEAFCVDSYREAGNSPTPEPDQVQKKKMDKITEKVCLQEVGKIYGKMVDRLGDFDQLSFQDSQLQEASRCYLYGFFRACVVLSAAALETKLKRATGLPYVKEFSELVDKAVQMGKLDDANAEYARIVFGQRTQVVHHNANPDIEGALNVLDGARKVLSVLHE